MIAQQLLSALFVLWTAVSPAGSVEEVQITPLGQETQITIVTEGAVEVDDFLLRDPTRLVVDIKGAAHGLPRYAYNEIGRGGVVSMRSSQFRDGVVRLVFDLSGPPQYTLSSEMGSVRIRFRNPGGSFEAWTTGRGSRATGAVPGASTSGATESVGASTAAAGDGQPAALPATPSAPSEQPSISVTYDQANMLDVLAGFSEFSGLSIVSGPAVGEKTVRGVEIRDKPWDVALDAILSSQGLDWKRLESGIIIVDDAAALRSRDTLRTETRVFRINYADAAEVSDALGNLASAGGQVVPYEGTNSVIVTDAPSVVGRMDSLVSVLDQRTPQVSIEAKIIFVDRTNVNNMGIVYDLKDLQGNQINDVTSGIDPTTGGSTDETIVDLGGESVAALANANDRLANPALQILASAAFGDFSLSAFIEALSSHQLSDIQAAPSIQVMDNHRARIQVGERTPIRILEPQAQQQRATVNVQFEDTGIILEATPHITNNNQILIDLHAERSGLAEASGDVGLVFDKQVGETRLLLDDGETAVIAGLTLSEITRFESGIPILMDLPLLGPLFRTTRETENKQDLIILVTPHIISSPQRAAMN